MPDQMVYYTASGNVPNGGVPPGTMFISVGGFPPSPYRPIPGGHSAVPTLRAPRAIGEISQGTNTPRSLISGTGNSNGYPPVPEPHAPRVLPPPWLHRDHGSILLPSELTTICWVLDGLRPCDSPDGYHPDSFYIEERTVVPSMTVKELIKQLGAPAGEHFGIAELLRVGNPGDARFAEGLAITQGSREANWSLARAGWGPRGGKVMLMVKR